MLFLLWQKTVLSSIDTDANKWIWELFYERARNVPQSCCLSWRVVVALGGSLKPRKHEFFPQVLQLGHVQDAQ